MEPKYLKRIHVFHTVYMIISIIMLAGAAVGIILSAVFHSVIPAQFVYYGNDAVSGWATIFSAVGYLAGMIGRVMVLALIVCLIIAAVYWIIGLVLNYLMERYAGAAGYSCRGVGTALAVWIMVPGILTWAGIVIALIEGTGEIFFMLSGGVIGAIFLAAGIFLLLTVHEKI